MLYAAVRFVLGLLARYVYRPVVEGVENVPLDGPVILAANHLSFIDSFVIPLLAPRPVAMLAKAEYFSGRSVSSLATRTFFTALGAIAVERGANRSAQRSLTTALGVLQRGGAFGIYPEGSRSRDGRLYRGHTGVAWLALVAECPVVPVGVIGTDRLQPVGARLPRLARVTVRFGEPIHPAAAGTLSPARARRELTDTVMAQIARLSEQVPATEYSPGSTLAA